MADLSLLGSGPGLGDARARVMHSGTQERHGVVDSGKLKISREELERLECMVEAAGPWTPLRAGNLCGLSIMLTEGKQMFWLGKFSVIQGSAG